MSAFIVNDGTINDILSYLKLGKDLDWLRRSIENRFGYRLDNDEDYEQFGGKLYLMNVAAVDDRCNEANDSVKILQEFKYKIKGVTTMLGNRGLNVSTMQVYKSAQCLSYQCAEGDVPESNLYKCLDFIIKTLAESIVRSLPAYDKANWD